MAKEVKEMKARNLKAKQEKAKEEEEEQEIEQENEDEEQIDDDENAEDDENVEDVNIAEGDENVEDVENVEGDENAEDVENVEGDEDAEGIENAEADENGDGDENPDDNEENDEALEEEETDKVNDESAISGDGKKENEKTKKELELTFSEEAKKIIDEIMQTKIKLSDDTESLIFSRGPRYRYNWPINCHLCSVAHILNAAELKKHINDKAHQAKLTGDPPDAETFRKPFIQPFCKPLTSLNNPIKIFPGEIIEKITPDLYDRLQKIEEFEFRKPSWKELLDILEDEPVQEYNLNAPVLGLSYVLKFRNPFSVIDYFCLLCRTKCSGDAYQHLVGGVHQMNYIHKHFPIMYKNVKEALGALKPESQKERCIRSIFRKIYRKFEELRGFRKIHIILFKDYKMGNKEKFRKFQFRKLVHYAENMLEIPEKDIDEWIAKCKNGEVIIEPDPVTLRKPKRESRDAAASDPSSRKRRQTSPRRRDSSPPPPRKMAREESSRLDDTSSNWDRYRRMLGAALDDIDREFAEYEGVPESHPDYEVEWRKYWRRRSKDLEKDNIDPSYYDFKPEWLEYWAGLLKDLHKKEVSKCKFEIKRKLRLPYDKRSPSPIRRRRLRSPRRSRSRPRRRSPSPEPSYRERRRHSRSPRNYDRSRPRSRDERDEETSYIAGPPEPLGVISVLRQLTVLEDQLGSLGPKALEYLSRAVLFEKERNKPADELMREKEFYIFFVTAKEKLKGQLMANIVERTKIKAANNAVKDLEILLNMFEDYMRQNSGRNPFTNNNPPIPIRPPPMHYMGGGGGNQMENIRPGRNVFDAPNNNQMNQMNQMNPAIRRLPRQMEGAPPPRNQYNPPNIQSEKVSNDDDMMEAPPPPRNLFNVQNDSDNNNQEIDTAPQRRNQFHPPNNDFRGNKSNMNQMNESFAPPRNQQPQFYSPMNDLRQRPYQPQGSVNLGRPQQPNQYSGGKGGIWQSGANQSFRSNPNFSAPTYGGNFIPNTNYPGNPSGMGMMTASGMGGGGGRGGFAGGFRGKGNPVGNNTFRGGMHRGFNN